MIGQNDIRAAYARIRPHVRRTPVIRANARDFGVPLDRPLALKLEFLQHTGTFKPRGAFNNLLSRAVPAAGVAAASGGNHGAAVAYAAQRLGHKATIFVPDVSSPVKVARIKSYGADTRVGGARYADALDACNAFIATSGALSVHAYDAAETVAGQGSVGLEWEEDAGDLDTVLVAVGGGGLIAGIAAWYGRRVKVVGVEPEGSRCLHASLEAGRPVDVTVESIAADSLGARNTGQLVFDIARANVDHVALVPDDAIFAAQRLLWDRLRVAAEPGGAAALAALTSARYKPRADEKIGVLLCGANVDLAKLAGNP
ncbi:MAG: threonine dehydratase [Hyphomicrobiales bacterium]|jgi:threonine dehydratase|nr:threonine dehydratase [Hyphomicrobiales bacterium]